MKMIDKKINVTIVGWYLSNILIYNGIIDIFFYDRCIYAHT